MEFIWNFLYIGLAGKVLDKNVIYQTFTRRIWIKKNITSDTQTNGCSTVIFEFPDKTSPVSRRTDIKVQSLSHLTVDSVAWVKLTAVRLLSGSGQCGRVNGSISRGGEEVWTPGDCTNGHTEHSYTVVTLWHSLDTFTVRRLVSWVKECYKNIKQ